MGLLKFSLIAAFILFVCACGGDEWDNPYDPKNANEDHDGDGIVNGEDENPKSKDFCSLKSPAMDCDNDGIPNIDDANPDLADKLFFGATESDVERILGRPDSMSNNEWIYDSNREICSANLTCKVIFTSGVYNEKTVQHLVDIKEEFLK